MIRERTDRDQLYSYDKYRDGGESRPAGLGDLIRKDVEALDGTKYVDWWYKTPKGLITPIGWLKPGVVPPLPRPKNEWERCGCHKGQHVCSQCGMPYWVEIHGVADGFCTYCYHKG